METHDDSYPAFPIAMVEVLLASGWEPGRKISIDDWVMLLNSEGWPNPKGMQALLLECLGGLILRPQLNQESLWGQDPIRVDPIAASCVCDRKDPENDPARIRCVEERIGESLYPFAEPLVAAPVTYFTTPSGRLIAAGSGIAYSLGNDFESSFHNFSKQTTMPSDL